MVLRVSEKTARERGWISAEQEKARPKARRAPGQLADFACPIEGADPQSILWRALLARFPQAARNGDLVWEAPRVIPGRRFRVDILWRSAGIAIEVDGYQFHGLNKGGFHRDRQKDRLLMREGWRVVRYSARDITQQCDAVIAELLELAAMGGSDGVNDMATPTLPEPD